MMKPKPQSALWQLPSCCFAFSRSHICSEYFRGMYVQLAGIRSVGDQVDAFQRALLGSSSSHGPLTLGYDIALKRDGYL
jgi:hypothetical protein